jgi:hypothetical protein
MVTAIVTFDLLDIKSLLGQFVLLFIRALGENRPIIFPYVNGAGQFARTEASFSASLGIGRLPEWNNRLPSPSII